MIHCTGPSIDNADLAAALLDSFLVWPYPNAKHVRYVIMFFFNVRNFFEYSYQQLTQQ